MAILHGNRDKLLGFHEIEHPISLQIGGDRPRDLAECARIGEEFGYDEINLNVGCPSSRVQDGNFGACLMLQPERVAECVAAMQSATKLPVTVKHRIGVDDRDSYQDLINFIAIVSETKCDRFTVHARKAWLSGLSPRENREVPPLRYADVHRLKQDFPHLAIEINGGIVDLDSTREQLQFVDAVMIGRAAYDNPYLFATVDRDFYGDTSAIKTRKEVAIAMLPYIQSWAERGIKLTNITRHLLALFGGQPGSRAWRRILTEKSIITGAGTEVVVEALTAVGN